MNKEAWMKIQRRSFINTSHITRRSIVNRFSRPLLACGLGLLMVGLLAVLLTLPAGAAVGPAGSRPAAPAPASKVQQPQAGAVIHVPGDADSIQEAIDMAADGDEVQVQGGSYYEHLVVTKTIRLTGGWNITFTEQTKERTIVDASDGGRCLTVLPGPDVPTVVISNVNFLHGNATGLGGVITPTVPQALTPGEAASQAVDTRTPATRAADLRAGLVDLAAQGQFPGGQAALDQALARIDALTAAAQPAQHATVKAVAAANGEIDGGGGIYVRGARLHLMNARVDSSTASHTASGAGGAICAVDVPTAGLVLEHVVMAGNTASRAGEGYGGALFFGVTGQGVTQSLTLSDVAFRDNQAALTDNGYGGGAFVSGAPGAQFTLAIFTSNMATSGGLSGFGGGLYLDASSDVTMTTVGFELNTANTNLFVTDPTEDWITGLGGAIYARDTASLSITSPSGPDDPQSIFLGNVATLKGLGLGGGLYADTAPNVRVERVRFLGNWAVIYVGFQGDVLGGGGVYVVGSPGARVVENTFSNNMAGVFNLEDLKLFGGAIEINGSDDVAVTGNHFDGNACGTSPVGGNAFGGAVDIAASDVVTVSGNVFVDNVADLGPSGGLGGALHLEFTNDALVHGNTFVRNRAGTGSGIGGALTIERLGEGLSGFSQPQGGDDKLNNRVTVSANTFRDNRVAVDLSGEEFLLGGAAAFNSMNGLTLANNVLDGNVAGVGGALALIGWDVNEVPHDVVRDALVVNNTLVNNTGQNGVYLEMWTTPITLTNNVVVSHTLGIQVATNVQGGGMTAGVHYTVYNENGTNSAADPDSTLVESHAITAPVEFVDRWRGNYHLRLISSARDAGDPAGVPPAPSVDVDGTPRPFGPRVDVGAYEWHGYQLYLPLAMKGWRPCVGWVVGIESGTDQGLLFHTSNSGATWTIQGTDADRQYALNGVSAVDTNNAWVTGNHGTILRTRDGGLTWQHQTMPPELPSDVAVNFVTAASDRIAWALAGRVDEPSYILYTPDSGDTWAVQYEADVAPGHLNWIEAASTQVAYVVGGVSASLAGASTNEGVGRIYRTTDSGLHWEQSPNPAATVISVHAVNETQAWAVGKEGSILRTYDAGATWEALPGGGGVDYNAVFTFDGREVWVVGDEELIMYTSNGQDAADQVRWETQYPPDDIPGSQWFMDVRFVTNKEGWIAGIPTREAQDGSILHTTDGGKTWKLQPHPVQGEIWHLSMVCGE
jgi:photosystem II stability/assembly factor-like uncharacterized protein